MINATKDFIQLLKRAPTAYHAVSEIGQRLAAIDFTPLDEKDKWDLKKGASYFIEHKGALLAFTLPKKKPKRALIAAAHTDSPALKIKPNGSFEEDGMLFFRSEVYGGLPFESWLNRDLAIAGKIVLNGEEQLVYLDDTPLIIPALAIHFRHKKKLKCQDHAWALASLAEGKNSLFPQTPESSDLFLVPKEPPSFVGQNSEMLAAYRLDNLTGAYAALVGLMNAKPADETLQIAYFAHHEEIGSRTDEGAGSPFLTDTLQRICMKLGVEGEDFFILKNQSHLYSIDTSHGYHPAYKALHDPQHHCHIGGGPVIKTHAAQKYMGDAATIAFAKRVAEKEGIPLQIFSSHSDVTCGSTLGPIAASATGLNTLDLGIGLISMHTPREIIALNDQLQLNRLIKAFLSEENYG